MVDLRSNHRSILAPGRAPRVIEVGGPGGYRKLRGELLVELDAQARLLIREHVAVFDLRAPGEDLSSLRREVSSFVDAEVVARKFQGQLRRVRQGGSVAGS